MERGGRSQVYLVVYWLEQGLGGGLDRENWSTTAKPATQVTKGRLDHKDGLTSLLAGLLAPLLPRSSSLVEVLVARGARGSLTETSCLLVPKAAITKDFFPRPFFSLGGFSSIPTKLSSFFLQFLLGLLAVLVEVSSTAL